MKTGDWHYNELDDSRISVDENWISIFIIVKGYHKQVFLPRNTKSEELLRPDFNYYPLTTSCWNHEKGTPDYTRCGLANWEPYQKEILSVLARKLKELK